MNCRDTERLWNELLDTRTIASIELEAALESHARQCPSCAAIASRYRTLRAALTGWKSPAATPEFLERLHVLSNAPPAVLPFQPRPIWTSLKRLAAAAAVVLAAWFGWTMTRPAAEQPVKNDPIVQLAPAPYSITDSFVEVTSATLDFARETSAPAGRIGRDVLASTSLPEASVVLRPQVSVIPTTDVLQSVGGRVGATVRPLSGSARQAFGFLIRAASQDERPVPTTATPRGT